MGLPGTGTMQKAIAQATFLPTAGRDGFEMPSPRAVPACGFTHEQVAQMNWRHSGLSHIKFAADSPLAQAMSAGIHVTTYGFRITRDDYFCHVDDFDDINASVNDLFTRKMFRCA